MILLALQAALAAQPVTIAPAEGGEPWAPEHVAAVKAATEKCVAAKPWIGKLDLEPFPGEAGVSYRVGALGPDDFPLYGTPGDCIADALNANKTLTALEWPAGLSIVLAEDPTWRTGVTVEGIPSPAKEAVQLRFGQCTAGRPTDTTFATEIYTSGYSDPPVASLGGYGMVPATETGEAIRRCAHESTLDDVPWKSKDKTAFRVTVRTKPLTPAKVTLTPTGTIPPAVLTGLQDALGRCGAIHAFAGEFGYDLRIQAGGHNVTVSHPTGLPDPMQQCVTGSIPLGIPTGEYAAQVVIAR